MNILFLGQCYVAFLLFSFVCCCFRFSLWAHFFWKCSFFFPLNLEDVLRKFSGRKAIFQENIKNDVSQFLETISLKKTKKIKRGLFVVLKTLFWEVFQKKIWTATEHGSISCPVFLESVVSIPPPFPYSPTPSPPLPLPLPLHCCHALSPSPLPFPSSHTTPLPSLGSESFWTQSLGLSKELEAEKLGERVSTRGLRSQPWGWFQWICRNKSPPLVPHTHFNMNEAGDGFLFLPWLLVLMR